MSLLKKVPKYHAKKIQEIEKLTDCRCIGYTGGQPSNDIVPEGINIFLFVSNKDDEEMVIDANKIREIMWKGEDLQSHIMFGFNHSNPDSFWMIETYYY
jgi:hypothetical protein